MLWPGPRAWGGLTTNLISWDLNEYHRAPTCCTTANNPIHIHIGLGGAAHQKMTPY